MKYAVDGSSFSTHACSTVEVIHLIVVRHPFTRFVSAYNFLMQHRFLRRRTTVEVFLEQARLAVRLFELLGAEYVAIGASTTLTPQVQFLMQPNHVDNNYSSDNNNVPSTSAKDTLPRIRRIQKVLRFKQLATDWIQFTQQYAQLGLPTTLRKLNVARQACVIVKVED